MAPLCLHFWTYLAATAVVGEELEADLSSPPLNAEDDIDTSGYTLRHKADESVDPPRT